MSVDSAIQFHRGVERRGKEGEGEATARRARVMRLGSLSVEQWNQLLAEGTLHWKGPDELGKEAPEDVVPAEPAVGLGLPGEVPVESLSAPAADWGWPDHVTLQEPGGSVGAEKSGEAENGVRFGSVGSHKEDFTASSVPTSGGAVPPNNIRRSWATVASAGIPAPGPPKAPPMDGNQDPSTAGDHSPAHSEPSARPPTAVKDPYSIEDQARELFGISLIEEVPSGTPRGLVNDGNRCFINVVLQSLLACTPFRQLLFSLSNVQIPDSMPLLEKFIVLAKEMFENDGRDEGLLDPIQPDFVFCPRPGRLNGRDHAADPLQALISGGSQEDAQEFLVHALDKLHEETLPAVDKGSSQLDDDEGWEEVVGKKQSVVLQKSDYTPSCVACIFGGLLRSELRLVPRNINQKPSVTKELDIENSHVQKLDDALFKYFEPESLEDYVLESSNEAVEAKKHFTLDRLPRVLILHLKRFSYNAKLGGSKISKKIEYPEELRINSNFLSPNCVASSKVQRSYQLTAIVAHIGNEMAGGHYTCDVRVSNDSDKGGGSSGWVHCDDSVISPVARNTVFSRQAYLLFYTLIA